MKQIARIFIAISLVGCLSFAYLPQIAFAECGVDETCIDDTGSEVVSSPQASAPAPASPRRARAPTPNQSATSPPDAASNPGSGSENTPSSSGSPQSIPSTFDTRQLKLYNQKSYVPDGNTANPDPSTTGIIGFLIKVVSLFVKIIASLSLLIFIIGALMAISSEGKEDRLEKGKNAMLYAVIGLVIALFSFIIVAFVQSILF